MGWVRLDDEFYDNPKLEDAGPLGMALWVAAIGYCNRKLTDGRLPKSVVRRLLDFNGIAWGGRKADPIAVADHLVECGLFEPGPGGSYLIHDYLEFQPSAADVGKRREDNKVRIAEWRAKKRRATG